VPTTRPRIVITETDAVAQALAVAARRWPQERGRARLLLRLVEEGARASGEAEDRAAQERRRLRLEAVERTAGVGTGWYPAGYLEDLRADWPE